MQRLTWLLAAIVVGATIAASSCTHDNNPLFCNDSSTCAVAGKPYCDVIKHECLAAPDGFIPMDFSHLDGDAAMSECTTTTQCTTPDKPICSSAGSCSRCLASDDNAACKTKNTTTPRCDTASGQCVTCLPANNTQSPDCAAATPICDPAFTCRACKAHAECTSGVCKADGTCAGTNEIVYVDNGNQLPATCALAGTHDGASRTTAFCDIQAGVGSGKLYVVVAGSSMAYSAVTISSGTVTIVGPGRNATPPAQINQALSPAVSISPPSGTVNATLDGLDLVGASGTMPQRRAGVLCQGGAGTATVTVRNCGIHDSGLAGVDSTSCTIELDGNIIGAYAANGGNAGGGIKLSSSPYSVTNNIIALNGNSGRGVTIDDPSTGVFTFNTVAKNTVAAGVGGIDCGAGGMKAIANSIFWGNSATGGTQLGAQCALTNVVTATGDDNRGSMDTLPPAFVSATDFHLIAGAAANTACCVDKMMTDPGTPNKGHDVDGTNRPKGTGRDYGAHEVQ